MELRLYNLRQIQSSEIRDRVIYAKAGVHKFLYLPIITLIIMKKGEKIISDN